MQVTVSPLAPGSSGEVGSAVSSSLLTSLSPGTSSLKILFIFLESGLVPDSDSPAAVKGIPMDLGSTI